MTVAPRYIGNSPLSRSATQPALAMVLAMASSTGCDSCRRDRPYTPFRVDSDASTAATAAPSASASASARSVDVVPIAPPTEGRKLEPPLGRFEVGSRSVELPKGLLGERVLERPSAGTGQADALVWAIPAKPDSEWNGPMGELWLFPAGGDAKKLLDLPGWMPSGPGCLHQSRLALLGAATTVVDVSAKCERSLTQRTPMRALALVSLAGATPTPLLGLRIAEPAPDESFTVTPLMADRDGDGREDPSFRIDFDVSTSQTHATAEVGWLDRAAGPSIDEGRLSAALEPTLVALEGTLGKKAKLAATLADVLALRRLLGTMCQQSATSRIFDWRGEALRCPGLTQAATRLARIEVKAALGLGDPLEAAHALAFSSTWLGGLPAVEREDLRKRISKSLGQVKTGLPVATSVRPMVPSDPVHFSPLRFEADGALLVQSTRRVLERISKDGTSTVIDGDAGIAAWPLSVTAPNGRRWASVVPACDRSELSLGLTAADGQFLPLVPTRLLAPRPGVCRNPSTWPTSTSPIHWQGDNPVALLDGICWAGQGAHPCPTPYSLGPVVPGSPRSPDGRHLVVMTGLGPIVTSGAKPELWSGPGIDGKRLSDCVVANDAKAIACVADAALLFVTRPEAANP